MKIFVSLLLSLIQYARVEGLRTFVDDLGVTHTTNLEKPKIVTWAHRAVSLSHYGLDTEQLLGTYGEWANAGSDFDFNNPEAGSSFPADPNTEELELLKSVVNLSPSCGAEYCVDFDFETFKLVRPDFFIIHGYRHSPWAINSSNQPELLEKITEFMGRPPIYTDVSLEGEGETCSLGNEDNCYGKSMIDVIEQNFDVATFLNLDVPDSLNEERQRLCESALTFQSYMKIAQDNGVRAMAAYLVPSPVGTSYLATPVDDMVLRMFEELGMPILHPGSCPDKTLCKFEYFWEWLPNAEYFNQCSEGQDFATCNSSTLYPVDFWLYDHRTTFTITNPDFQLAFPDRAIIKKQYAYWPIGGRMITPHHAAEILDIVGPAMAGADRIYPETACTPEVDVVSKTHRTVGLPGGSYSCFNDAKYHESRYYEECQLSNR